MHLQGQNASIKLVEHRPTDRPTLGLIELLSQLKMFKYCSSVVVQRLVCDRPLLEVDFHKNTHYMLQFYRQNLINKNDLSFKTASKTTNYFDVQSSIKN